MVPKERLLEYKLDGGWEPLCHFLKREIPNEPFPFVNERSHFSERIGLMEKQALTRAAKQILPVVGAVAIASAWYFGFLDWVSTSTNQWASRYLTN